MAAGKDMKKGPYSVEKKKKNKTNKRKQGKTLAKKCKKFLLEPLN